MKKAKDLDDYLAMQTPEMVKILLKVRQTIKKAAPKAEEVISYGMPAFKQDGMLVYYAAFKKHYSLFPASTSAIKAFKKKLASYETSKGTIKFDPALPVPVKLIAELVKFRLKENKLKKARKQSKR